MGGTYSGQVVLWDSRAKATPVQVSAKLRFLHHLFTVLGLAAITVVQSLPYTPCLWHAYCGDTERSQPYHSLHGRAFVCLDYGQLDPTNCK